MWLWSLMFKDPAVETPLFLRKWTRQRMPANGLGIILFRYANWLCERGYSRDTIRLLWGGFVAQFAEPCSGAA